MFNRTNIWSPKSAAFHGKTQKTPNHRTEITDNLMQPRSLAAVLDSAEKKFFFNTLIPSSIRHQRTSTHKFSNYKHESATARGRHISGKVHVRVCLHRVRCFHQRSCLRCDAGLHHWRRDWLTRRRTLRQLSDPKCLILPLFTGRGIGTWGKALCQAWNSMRIKGPAPFYNGHNENPRAGWRRPPHSWTPSNNAWSVCTLLCASTQDTQDSHDKIVHAGFPI